jgi:hypothetical protein
MCMYVTVLCVSVFDGVDFVSICGMRLRSVSVRVCVGFPLSHSVHLLPACISAVALL